MRVERWRWWWAGVKKLFNYRAYQCVRKFTHTAAKGLREKKKGEKRFVIGRDSKYVTGVDRFHESHYAYFEFLFV